MPEDRSHDTDPAVALTDADPAAAAVASVAPPGNAPRSIRSGDVLGRYEVGEELGEGGMATVFRARDRELRRDVAVKVLFPHLAKRDEVVRRFHREARAAAGLEHANILRIYDVGGHEPATDPKARGELDPPYIVMELIRGRTLLQEIEQRGPILAEVVACIGALLADALAAAHAAGIIHRDIKPSNVLIAHGGRLLLADFGVARLETEDSLVTRTGALLGTPAYMSPEQASGDTATARSDVYSLGATLYQLSTGLLPYSGSPAKVMSAIASGQLVAPIRRRAAVGPDLSRAIEQMMETDPEARPATAAEVAAELRRIAAAGGLGEPTDELAAFFADADGFMRARSPAVVGAIIGAARRAIAEQRLPRAVALADRATALAPDDPQVVALVEAVTEGGRSRGRRRAVALGALGLVVAGGAVAGGLALGVGSDTPAPDATPDAPGDRISDMVPDAAVDRISDRTPDIVPDAAPDAAIDRISDRTPIDAGFVRAPRDAALAGRDATALAALSLPDAALPPDAAPIPVDAAPPALGTLQVINDTWCNLTIDDTSHGRIVKTKTIQLAVGPHVVRCEQPGTALAWRREVDILANQTAVVTQAMLADVEALIAVSGDRVTIDGVAAARGATVRLKPGQHRVVVFRGDREVAAGWVAVPRTRSCRLREIDAGKLVCDP